MSSFARGLLGNDGDLNRRATPWSRPQVLEECPQSASVDELGLEEGATTAQIVAQLNTSFLTALDSADLLLIAGEGSSHCVCASTEHLLQHLLGRQPERIVLLTDCMSPVADFEAQHPTFLDAAQTQGVQLRNSKEIRL